jgi:hypothetical protein
MRIILPLSQGQTNALHRIFFVLILRRSYHPRRIYADKVDPIEAEPYSCAVAIDKTFFLKTMADDGDVRRPCLEARIDE